MTGSVQADAGLIEKLVLANQILYDQGVVDGLGHVSVRHDQNPGRFLLSRNRAPALVQAADILCYDLDGVDVANTGQRSYLERFIHAEIYRARPDVQAVVHSHSPNVIPFGATGQRLRPIFHMAGFLGSGTARFDTHDVVGDSDLLIGNAELGAALARALDSCSCVLMRGHGSTVVGTSIEQVVYRAIYSEVNARLQLNACTLGEVKYLTPGEADLAAASNDTQIGRSWELWWKQVTDKRR
ncbi:class II aldolase/adducin family protein [Aquabacterium sp. J223]|uniref:class II aldolase/adducin family protein n=1 Tax=Aquabacterium sp. J223 TaxID=2898431 RepID=UPI0021ADEB57|nr:class II aldolase/adducin family protein [Aquabacterium sp. J223]UUX95305.1 class II aldolase/adducin family protein [Aquabacterium sp. J223]